MGQKKKQVKTKIKTTKNNLIVKNKEIKGVIADKIAPITINNDELSYEEAVGKYKKSNLELESGKLEKKINRSDRYQNLFAESSFPSEILESFPNEDSVYKRLNPFAYNDEIAELQEQLRVEFWRIVEENLTSRQREVVQYTAQGLTQTEAAKLLGVNQSSVVKSLNGNQSYKKKYNENDEKNKSYGGIKKKIRKILETDEKVVAILNRIRELREETWA